MADRSRQAALRLPIVQAMESRRLFASANIIVIGSDEVSGSLFNGYTQAGTLLTSTPAPPSGPSDGGPHGIAIDKSGDIQAVYGGGSLELLTDSPAALQYSSFPGWKYVGRTFYGGVGVYHRYVFTTNKGNETQSSATNGLIRFDTKNGYASIGFAPGLDCSEVSVGQDGLIYAKIKVSGTLLLNYWKAQALREMVFVRYQ